MARKLRIEFPGARYHVINRGNYRDHVFAEDGAKQAFLKCLGEAAAKCSTYEPLGHGFDSNLADTLALDFPY